MNDPAKDKNKDKWVAPGEYALCRKLTGGDMAAGILLHRIAVMWKLRKTKLKRWDRDWLAMSREDWARSVGLSDAEMKDRALPRVKKACASFIEIRTMKIEGVNKIWVHLDLETMAATISESLPWDMYELALNGLGIFPKEKKYPYKKDPE